MASATIWGSACARIVGGKGAGSSPSRRFGPTRRSRVTTASAWAGARAAAGALTISPPRSSSMSAPEERRSSGTVSNAAGQLLRSGAGMETPGPDEAVVVRQQEIAPRQHKAGAEDARVLFQSWEIYAATNPGQGTRCRRFTTRALVQVVNFHQANSGSAIFAAFDRGVGAGREGYQDRRFGVI